MALEGDNRIAALTSYVPRAVLQFLAAGSAKPSEAHADRVPAALLLIDVSGFTPITASAIARGAAATEQLSKSFNAYLGQIIEIVAGHGGDIAKFVGDALIAQWLASDGDLPSATRQAGACALAIARLGDYEEPGVRLSVKVGLVAGETAQMHVGGLDGRWLFLVTGPALGQLSEIQAQLVTGDVVSSAAAWPLIADRFVGEPLADRSFRVRSSAQQAVPIPAGSLALPAVDEDAIRAYVPQVLLSRVDAGQQDWLAELRRTSVVFVSVRGMAAQSADALMVVDSLAKAAQRVAARFDGWHKEVTVDEKGTSLTLVFGVPPFTHEDDAARAIAAGVAIEAEIRNVGLESGVGVATGPTFCGPAGNSLRQEFAMLGGHLNLAARLMQAADSGTLLCDGETHAAALGTQTFDRLPPYVLKGLETPTDVYRVARTREPEQRAAPLVDRASELTTAVAALEALATGTGGLIVVEGDPGIGKSRVIADWVDRARTMRIRVLSGRATDIDDSTQYHAWRPILEELLELSGVAERPRRATVVRAQLGFGGVNLELAPLLSPLLSLDLSDSELTAQMSGEVRADNTAEAVVGLLRAGAKRGPVLITLEDVQWLDSASWQLVLRARTDLPELLFVLSTRPIAEASSETAATIRDEATVVRLGPFSRADTVTLAAQRSGASQLDEAVATLVYERAEGNPLFIEQLTYAMRDGGQVVVDHGVLKSAASSAPFATAAIPDSIQRVITTRLDQLPPAQALTIKAASVIGQRFAVRTLADIHPVSTSTEELSEQLETLSRLNLIGATQAAEPSFEFSHKITQEVAYNLMPSTQSKQLHRKVAEWYERGYADDLSPFFAFLAYHWRNADEPQRAVGYLELAGLGALRSFANEEAIDFLRQALDLSARSALDIEPAARARWLLALGEAYVNLSRYREGRDHLEQGLSLMRKPPPSVRGTRSLSLVGQIARQASHRGGLRSVRSLSDDERADLVAVSRAYERLAEAAYYDGDTALALYSSIRILNEAEVSGSAPEIARGLAGTGALFGLAPLHRVARSYLAKADAQLAHVDDATTHEIVRIVIGFYHVGTGGWDAAREQFNMVRSIARRIGDRRRLLDALGNLLELEYLRGSVRDALELADEVIAVARARGDGRFEADALIGRAYALFEMDRTQEALRSLAQVREQGLRSPELPVELRIKTQGLLAIVSRASGNHVGAIAAADEAMRLTYGQRPTYFGTYLGYVGPATVYLEEWESGGSAQELRPRVDDAIKRLKTYADVFPIGSPRYQLLAGRREWAIGNQNAALGRWRRALDEATKLSMGYEQGLAQYELGRHLSVGDPERSRHFDAARDALTPLGASRLLALLATALVAGTGG